MESARSNKRNSKRQTRRAVIDIGSNTVRLVIYGGPDRVPDTIWNEKVAARLGRDLSDTGAIPEEAEAEALGALERYALILRDLGIEEVQTVATAAARDASNGPDFLAKVAALGLEPRLLTGEEEARASAMGAIGAFPGADGVVADLGGGSLELIQIGDGESHHGASLPLGTLRLPQLRAQPDFAKRVRVMLGKVGWAQAHPGPLYMIGGTWRALASYAMHVSDYPLTDPHAYELPTDKAVALSKELVHAKPDKLVKIGGISPMRASYLPDAACLLQVMLEEFAPEHLIFSSWGLREGLLFDQLDPLKKVKDPLATGVDAFASELDASITNAVLLAAWTVAVANGDGQRNEGLRQAAAQLAMALQRVEPNLRVNHATEWALDKRWIGCDARGRAMICAALLGSLGRTALPDSFRQLADDDDLREGLTWGLGFRLARRLGASSRASLTGSSLIRDDGRLVLRIDDDHRALARYPVTLDLEMLAEWLELEPAIEIASN